MKQKIVYVSEQGMECPTKSEALKRDLLALMYQEVRFAEEMLNQGHLLRTVVIRKDEAADNVVEAHVQRIIEVNVRRLEIFEQIVAAIHEEDAAANVA